MKLSWLTGLRGKRWETDRTRTSPYLDTYQYAAVKIETPRPDDLILPESYESKDIGQQLDIFIASEVIAIYWPFAAKVKKNNFSCTYNLNSVTCHVTPLCRTINGGIGGIALPHFGVNDAQSTATLWIGVDNRSPLRATWTSWKS